MFFKLVQTHCLKEYESFTEIPNTDFRHYLAWADQSCPWHQYTSAKAHADIQVLLKSRLSEMLSSGWNFWKPLKRRWFYIQFFAQTDHFDTNWPENLRVMSVFNPTWISKIPRGPKSTEFHVVATKWTKEYLQRTCKVTAVLTSSHWWNNVMNKRHNDMNVSIDWRKDITKVFQIFFM